MPIEVGLAFDHILLIGCIFILVVILICRNLRSPVYDINDDVSEKQFPDFNKVHPPSLPPSLIITTWYSILKDSSVG
jgi:hypothetical protein